MKRKTGSFTIIIRDFEAQCLVGIYDFERQAPQKLLLNIAILGKGIRAGASDDLTDSIDYEALKNDLEAQMKKTSFYLLEALAEHLAAHILKNKLVYSVKLRIEKLGILPQCKSVGVEIKRKKGWLSWI